MRVVPRTWVFSWKIFLRGLREI